MPLRFAPALLLIFTLLPIMSAAETYARQAGDTLSVVLEPIEVEATHSALTIDRAPISVSTMSRSMGDLVARRASTLDELTFTLPGIWISDRENHALGERMTIRGMGWRSQFGVRGIQVVLDDIPLTVADGQTVMNMIDPAMVQSLELLRGPSATFWGNSSGGVLYMRTRLPSDAPNFMLRSYAGSFSTMKHEARWHDTVGGVRWNAYGSYYDTEGYRDYSAATLVRGGLSAGFDLGESSTFEARLAYAGMPDAQHPGSLSAGDAANSPRMAAPGNVNTQSGKSFEQVMGSGIWLQDFDAGLLTVSAHGTWRDLTNPLPGPYIMVDRLAGGSRATFDFDQLPFRLQVGGELKWQRDERDQTNNEGGQPGDNWVISQLDRVGNQALFARAAVDAGKFSLHAAVRGDRMVFRSDSIDTASGDLIDYPDETRNFFTVNPSFGINYNLQDARLFANVSSSFEAPTTTEFKNRLGSDGNILPGFNPDLDPERAVGIEAGVRGFLNSLQLEYDLTLFSQFVSDQIIQETEIDGLALFSNGGDAEHFGLEVQLKYRPIDKVDVEVMYTWLDARFSGGDIIEEYHDNLLPGVAPHRAGLSIGWNPGDHLLSADVEYVGEYYADSENSVLNDSYMLLNARWLFQGLEFDNWRLQPFVSIYHILDTRYNTSVAINNNFGRYFEPGSGRSVQAGLSLQF